MAYEDDVIDLGVASEETLGGDGKLPDLVREIPETGLSDE
ncbi:benenodin family lasso peptide [Nostoc ellipsosporum NOK]|nr:benenodin family lasso peptide [Nostoc ellipsosporum NOK]